MMRTRNAERGTRNGRACSVAAREGRSWLVCSAFRVRRSALAIGVASCTVTLAQAQGIPPLPDSSGWGVHVLAIDRAPDSSIWVGTYGQGIFVLSTDQGVISDREARQKNAGGEILCRVW